MLKLPNGEIFAQVSELASRGLAELQDYPSVEIVAFVETTRLERVFARAKRPSEATLKTEVNLYGSIDDAKVIGDKLCAAKMFLQDPEHGTENVEYCNPHIAQFPGIEEPVLTTMDNSFSTGIQKSAKAVREERENFDQTVSAIYHSLSRSRNLERMQAGTMIQTPLLPHQETALCFMMQRELGPIPLEFRLWVPERNLMTTLYRHQLTDAESADQPNELGGGILADDMGMGKSLSTLALITATLEDAHSWSQYGAANFEKCRSRATLVIVPSTLIMNSWLKEIETRLHKSIKVGRYYGKGRNVENKEYLDLDIVFTTYHTVAYSMNQTESTIFSIKWFRIVLDEAHMIRRQETTLHQAASQLSANYRWCLTGTPIQNHLEDLGSLLSFLRLSQFENKAVFRKHIILPFADDIIAASKKFATLLDSVCLRRTQDLLHLPNISQNHHYITLTESERRQYDETLTAMASFIKEKASLNPDKRDSFGIFQAQLQLRLLCNHGTFQKRLARKAHRDRKAEREDFLYSLGSNAEITCSSCGIPIPVFDLLGGSNSFNHPCGHKLCQECISESQGDLGASSGVFTAPCPLCKMMVEQRPSDQGSSAESWGNTEGYFNQTGFSSKMNALMKDLEGNPTDAKSIIFSCWTRTLDLVSVHLRRNGILHQRIDGDQVLSQRQYNMDRFITDNRYPILLMSTGVGAFGLNLTAANHVYILEPQWNPSVETQAIGRVSRLGQTKAVTVTRYLVRGTVEVKMHSQQIRKVELANIGFQNAESID
ncbi:SNF2 family N-terminal domain-containing protein [Ilyonectria sp. MPI-CAGE-AT-0026]|nr:SNF2 family N-terminal domain-containing protein [Ilyonectria sp. MPI-CAGE-AT-0026]